MKNGPWWKSNSAALCTTIGLVNVMNLIRENCVGALLIP
jgi:hypothetical protein